MLWVLGLELRGIGGIRWVVVVGVRLSLLVGQRPTLPVLWCLKIFDPMSIPISISRALPFIECTFYLNAPTY